MKKHKIITIGEGQTALIVNKEGGFDVVGFYEDTSLIFILMAAYSLQTKECFDFVKDQLDQDPEYVRIFKERVSLSDGFTDGDIKKHENN